MHASRTRLAVDVAQRDAFLELVEDLRIRLGEIDAFAVAAEERLHRVPWTIAREHRRDLNRLGYYLALLVQTVSQALDNCDVRLAAAMKLRSATNRSAKHP